MLKTAVVKRDTSKPSEDDLEDLEDVGQDAFNGLGGLAEDESQEMDGMGGMSDTGGMDIEDLVSFSLSWSWGLAVLAALLELVALLPVVLSQRREDACRTSFNMAV